MNFQSMRLRSKDPEPGLRTTFMPWMRVAMSRFTHQSSPAHKTSKSSSLAELTAKRPSLMTPRLEWAMRR